MNQLGYVRHRAARGVRVPQAGSIAMVVGEDTARIFADPFFARFLQRVSVAAAAEDLLLIQLTLGPRDRKTVGRYLRAGHVDGVLFVSMHGMPDFDIGGLGIPVVVCGRPTSGSESVSYVDVDNVDGARQAVNHLLSSGRTTVATIAGPPDMAAGIDRLLGYRKALTATGPPDPGLIAYGDFTRRAGEHALFRLIDHRPKLDGVFAASDLMAAGALHGLRRLGRRVPEDVAVVGFDDAPLAQQTLPPLTTIRQPVDALAARMINELRAQMKNPDRRPVHVVLPAELIKRESG
jgi:DNA-binding LacI/PurR family transcriptional regulator